MSSTQYAGQAVPELMEELRRPPKRARREPLAGELVELTGTFLIYNQRKGKRNAKLIVRQHNH